jgi:L-ascorbate metabolism protein UlaG (beta-lactamase superfamily)
MGEDIPEFSLTYFGNACFMIESSSISVVFDPHDGKCMGIAAPDSINNYKKDGVDIVLCSHSHYDHNTGTELFVKPETFFLEQREGNFDHKNVKIKGIKVKHGEWEEWGYNIVYVVKFPNDFIVIHGGDIGYIPENDQLKSILSLGIPDVAILPIGGKYVTNAEEAIEISELLKPKITTVLCHYLYGNLCNLEDFRGMVDEKHFLEIMKKNTLISKVNRIENSMLNSFKKYLLFDENSLKIRRNQKLTT